MTTKKIETYKAAVAYAKQHIKELENLLHGKQSVIESLIEREIDLRIDELNEDERTANRTVYRDVYEDIMYEGSRFKFLEHCPSKYLTQEENGEWFDEHHDRYMCSGDHIANADYKDLMNFELSTLQGVDAYEYHDDIKKDYKVVEGSDV